MSYFNLPCIISSDNKQLTLGVYDIGYEKIVRKIPLNIICSGVQDNLDLGKLDMKDVEGLTAIC